MDELDFANRFIVLTRQEKGPLTWQTRLFEEWFAKGKFPDVIDLPTGMGKTMVMAIWLIAREVNRQLQIQRIVRSAVRAYNVVRAKRSATYQAAYDYVGNDVIKPELDKGSGKTNLLSQEGFKYSLATGTHGGVSVQGAILEEAIINLVALRTVTFDIKKRRYLLSLSLVEGADKPDNKDFKPIGKALNWLQGQSSAQPPFIIAPRVKSFNQRNAIVRFVPNNDDETHRHPELHRIAKPTMPTLFLLEPNESPEVHYVWDVTDKTDCPVNEIERAARSLTALGWGIDMAFADARLVSQEDVQQLKGVRWYPKPGTGSFEETLRVPSYDSETGESTLFDLRHCHSTAINRIEHGKPLKTVDKPKVFNRVVYSSVERPVARPSKVFKLLDSNEDPARYPHAKLVHIAGMVRHVAIKAMQNAGMDADFINHFIRGKRDPYSSSEHLQISYVPLPTIGHEHADGVIRNVMLIAPLGMERELTKVAEHIDGLELEPEGAFEQCESESSPINAYYAELRMFTPLSGKFIAKRYLDTSTTWHSVTPVILDGHNKKSKTDKPDAIARETEKLICKALKRAGVETPCSFTWQSIPFLKNSLSAHRYDRNGRHFGYHRPKHLKELTAVHVHITFDYAVSGPLTLGAGRHCGFGLMASIPNDDR